MKALRISKVLGVALASAAVLATGPRRWTARTIVPACSASARRRSSSCPTRSSAPSCGAPSSRAPDAFERAVLRASNAGPRPDDRAGARGPGAMPSTVASVTAARANDGFAWGDAFVGAAGVLSILLLGTATMLTIRHRGARSSADALEPE